MSAFEITYAAHTASCTFLLDAEGVCRRITLPNTRRNMEKGGRDATRLAARCVGAQYVASLDPTVSGMLAEMPRVGASMLFARVNERGRVSLVRTGIVTRFECHRAEDPFEDSDKAPSLSVQTSAPEISPSVPTVRRPRETALPPADPYREDGNDHTRPVQALRPQELARAGRRPSMAGPLTHEPVRDGPVGDDDVTLARGSDHELSPPRPRVTWPSPGAELTPPQPVTLRQPSVFLPDPQSDEDQNPYTGPGRSPVLRPGPPPPPPQRQRSERVARTTDPGRHSAPSYAAIDKAASGRRRGDR